MPTVIRIPTTAGQIEIDDPNTLTPLGTSDGRVVTHNITLTRTGTTLFVQDGEPPKTLEESISEFLKQEDYRQRRGRMYVESGGFSTTRLRYDLITAVAAQATNVLFAEESDLEKYIFRKHQGEGFAKETTPLIVEHIQNAALKAGYQKKSGNEEKQKGEPKKSSLAPSTVYGWLSGKIMHPRNHAMAIAIAKQLRSDAMQQRSEYIATTPKDVSDYYWLYNVHNHAGRELQFNQGDDIVPIPEKNGTAHSNGKVYGNLPEWLDEVIDSLRPRLVYGVKEAKALGDASVIEVPDGYKARQRRVRLVVVSPDNPEEKLKTFGIKSVRADEAIMPVLRKAYQASANFANALLDILIGFARNNPESANHLFMTYEEEGKTKVTPPREFWHIYSVAYGYSKSKFLELEAEEERTITRAFYDKAFANGLEAQLKDGLPKNFVLKKMFSHVYSNSPLFRANYSRAEFLKMATEGERQKWTQTANLLAKGKMADKQNFVEGMKIYGKIVGEAFKAIESGAAPEIDALRAADAELPYELAIIKGIITTRVPEGVNGAKLEGGNNLVCFTLNAFSINPEQYLDMHRSFEDGISSAAERALGNENTMRIILGSQPLGFRLAI